MMSRLYLHLYHERIDPLEDLDDWGSEGPTFGPYESVQITYGAHIKMHTPDGFNDLAVCYLENRPVFVIHREKRILAGPDGFSCPNVYVLYPFY